MSGETEQSPEQRLEALFGAEESEEVQETESPDDGDSQDIEDSGQAESEQDDGEEHSEEEQAPEPEDSAEEVDIDGETYRLPPKVAKAVIRQRDYTQKTQELAEQRRFLESEKQAVQIQQRLQGHLFSVQAEIAALDRALNQAQQVDVVAMMETDPIAAMKEQHRIAQLRDARQQKQAELQQRVHQAMQEQQQAVAQMMQQGQQVLSKRIKGWNAETAKEIASYGLKEGFTEGELSQVYDPRAVSVMWKAMQYDKLQQAKPQVAKKVQGKGIYVKPGSPKGPQAHAKAAQDAMRARLKKSGRIEDAEALLLARLEGRRR